MNNHPSPLRYPGGKASLTGMISEILTENKIDRRHYAEPYAGGCGLALKLLFSGRVSDIHINDLDPAVWAFWHSILEQTEGFLELMAKTPVTLNEWRKQKKIYETKEVGDSLRLGFATFFLNRTNRSGIIKSAGVIGGFKQNGNYRIDCRFNKLELEKRILRIVRYKKQINLYQRDAVDFISMVGKEIPANSFFYIDPPYFTRGSELYSASYKPMDHKMVGEEVRKLNAPWVMTYDNVDEIRQIYKRNRKFSFNINYSAQVKRVGTELLIASKGLKIPKRLRATLTKI